MGAMGMEQPGIIGGLHVPKLQLKFHGSKRDDVDWTSDFSLN